MTDPGRSSGDLRLLLEGPLGPWEVVLCLAVPTLVLLAVWVAAVLGHVALLELFLFGGNPYTGMWVESAGPRVPAYALGTVLGLSGLWAGVVLPLRRIARATRVVVGAAVAGGMLADLAFMFEFVAGRLPFSAAWIVVWVHGLLPPLWAALRVGYRLAEEPSHDEARS